MKEPHLFHWLNKLIQDVYNPSSSEFITTISPEQAKPVADDISNEADKITIGIRKRYLLAPGKVAAGELLRKYYTCINSLSMQLKHHQLCIGEDQPSLTIIYSSLEACLNKISERMLIDYGSEVLRSVSPALEEDNILVNMNNDQIALLLRAATESGMVDTLSISALLGAIAPHLSPPEEQDMSSYSMAGNHNIEITVNALEAMIQKLKGYQS